MNKKLGQHFLKNKQIVADILRAGEVSKNDVVLEVGPGKGVLTEALVEKAKKVIAVEKDKELVTWNLKHKTFKNVEFIHGDILKPEIWQKKCVSCLVLHASKYKIIANIPYYITSRFLRMFLSGTNNSHPPQPPPSYSKREGARGRALLPRPSLMVLMLQKEVAERIVARDGRESLLSLSVKAYGKPEIIKIVKRGNFSPPPKVDSAIIKITTSPPNSSSLSFDPEGSQTLNGKTHQGLNDPLSLRRRGGKKIGNLFSGDEVEKILAIAKVAFQQKRKMLRHSLGKNIPEKYQNRRPEELKLEDWREIMKYEA